MGAALNTPPEAMDAFSAKIRNVTDPADRLDALAGMEAAAPLIVAAELDRLVAETDWAWAVGSSLRARASELRGEG